MKKVMKKNQIDEFNPTVYQRKYIESYELFKNLDDVYDLLNDTDLLPSTTLEMTLISTQELWDVISTCPNFDQCDKKQVSIFKKRLQQIMNENVGDYDDLVFVQMKK